MTYEKHHFGANRSISIYHPTDLTFELHNHRSFELILVEEGEVEVVVDGQKQLIAEGQSFFLFPHQYHDITTKTHSILVIFIFSPELVEDFYQQTNDFYFANPLQDLSEELIEQTKAILLTETSTYKRKALLYHLIDFYIQRSPLVPAQHLNALVIDDILTYLEQNFTNQVTLQELSKKLDYSYNYLSALINSELKVSFNQLLNSYRVNFAIGLIKNSNLSMTDIAYQSGFQNTRSFNRNFKLSQHITPSDYKKIELE